MKNALWLKITAFILLVALFVAVSVFGIGVAYYYFNGGAELGSTQMLMTLYEEAMQEDSYSIFITYNDLSENGTKPVSTLSTVISAQYAPERTNLAFQIMNRENVLVLESPDFPEAFRTERVYYYPAFRQVTFDYQRQTFYGSTEQSCWEKANEALDVLRSGKDVQDVSFWETDMCYNEALARHELTVNIRIGTVPDNGYYVRTVVRQDLTAVDTYSQIARLVQFLADYLDVIIAVIIGSVVLGIALFVYLLCSVGHKKGVDGIYVNWFNRIPFDIVTVFTLGFACPPFFEAFSFGFLSTKDYIAAAILMTIAATLGLLFILSFAVRIKDRNVLKNTVCYRLFRFLLRISRRLLHYSRRAVEALPLYWQAGLVWCGLSLIELFFIAVSGREFLFFLAILEKLLLTPLLIFFVLNLRKLEKAGAVLAEGDLSYKVNLLHMPSVLRRHGENLNRISQGMARAVAQQTKSERMKTELITNVSHDLKTPLTSIINYVDLLKKEPAGSEAAAEYIEVLDRQSRRMKKLTEDLVEASKATSGAMQVNISPMDVNLLLSQSLAEYMEKLTDKNLTTVFQPGENLPQISADGRLLWRVFDNLLGNICKYAMEGTRVYITSAKENDRITIQFKNISATSLNISADELMERFVRGDSSRSTEGSGLGLSIAKSLLELQGGNMDLVIDGDLFKAVISLPCA